MLLTYMYSELFEMNNKCTNTAYNVLAVSGVFSVFVVYALVL